MWMNTTASMGRSRSNSAAVREPMGPSPPAGTLDQPAEGRVQEAEQLVSCTCGIGAWGILARKSGNPD